MINEEVRNRLKENEMEFIIEDTLNLYKKHDVKYARVLKPQEKPPNRLLGHNLMKLLHDYLYRSRLLCDSWFDSVNSSNILSIVLTTRAHMEGTGALAYLLKKLRHFYAGTIDETQVDDIIKMFVFADTWAKNIEMEKLVSVMSLIDAVDYVVKKDFGNDGQNFRDTYDLMCQYTHPNYLGVSNLSSINSKYMVRFPRKPVIRDEQLELIYHMHVSMDLFFHFLEEIENLLNNNEEVPVLLK